MTDRPKKVSAIVSALCWCWLWWWRTPQESRGWSGFHGDLLRIRNSLLTIRALDCAAEVFIYPQRHWLDSGYIASTLLRNFFKSNLDRTKEMFAWHCFFQMTNYATNPKKSIYINICKDRRWNVCKFDGHTGYPKKIALQKCQENKSLWYQLEPIGTTLHHFGPLRATLT